MASRELRKLRTQRYEEAKRMFDAGELSDERRAQLVKEIADTRPTLQSGIAPSAGPGMLSSYTAPEFESQQVAERHFAAKEALQKFEMLFRSGAHDWPAMIPELLTDITFAQAGAYVVNPAYAMQRKHNGKRLLLSTRTGRQAFNKRGEPCGSELLSALPGSITVDGELLSSSYVIFDFLDCLGHDLRNLPYSQRLALLGQAIASGAIELPQQCSVVETWFSAEDKEKYLLRAVQERWEGVVFKKLDALYAPGRAAQHLRLKFTKSCTARVRTVEPRSARLEMCYQNRWIEVCGVSLLGRSAVQVGDFVEVKYLYASMQSGEPRLIQPVMLERRDDVNDLDCSTEQLVFTEVE